MLVKACLGYMFDAYGNMSNGKALCKKLNALEVWPDQTGLWDVDLALEALRDDVLADTDMIDPQNLDFRDYTPNKIVNVWRSGDPAIYDTL